MSARMDKARAAAEQLYMVGHSIQDIARTLQVSANTVGKWSSTANWKEKKTRAALLEENSVQKLMEIFEYQVECLHVEMKANRDVEKFTPFAAGNFDALQKLYTTIRPDFQKFKLYLIIAKEIMEHVQAKDISTAKKIVPIMDEWINEKKAMMS